MISSNRLPELAALVRQAHVDIQHHETAAAVKTLAAGEMLVEAKALCGHGQWLNWLKDAGIHERAAQRYMLLRRAGFKSDILSYVGWAAAERFAVAGLKLVPSASHAMLAVGIRGEDPVTVAYWWPSPGDPALFHYLSTSSIDDLITASHYPVPAWALALTHGAAFAKHDAVERYEVAIEEAIEYRRQFSLAGCSA